MWYQMGRNWRSSAQSNVIEAVLAIRGYIYLFELISLPFLVCASALGKEVSLLGGSSQRT